jgi:DNA-binding NarL/FixJ family response regulator
MESPNLRVNKLLLVDAHSSFRQALAFVLNSEAGLEIVAQAGTLDEGRRTLDGSDLVAVEPLLPDGDGLELISDLDQRTILRFLL